MGNNVAKKKKQTPRVVMEELLSNYYNSPRPQHRRIGTLPRKLREHKRPEISSHQKNPKGASSPNSTEKQHVQQRPRVKLFDKESAIKSRNEKIKKFLQDEKLLVEAVNAVLVGVASDPDSLRKNASSPAIAMVYGDVSDSAVDCVKIENNPQEEKTTESQKGEQEQQDESRKTEDVQNANIFGNQEFAVFMARKNSPGSGYDYGSGYGSYSYTPISTQDSRINESDAEGPFMKSDKKPERTSPTRSRSGSLSYPYSYYSYYGYPSGSGSLTRSPPRSRRSKRSTGRNRSHAHDGHDHKRDSGHTHAPASTITITIGAGTDADHHDHHDHHHDHHDHDHHDHHGHDHDHNHHSASHHHEDHHDHHEHNRHSDDRHDGHHDHGHSSEHHGHGHSEDNHHHHSNDHHPHHHGSTSSNHRHSDDRHSHPHGHHGSASSRHSHGHGHNGHNFVHVNDHGQHYNVDHNGHIHGQDHSHHHHQNHEVVCEDCVPEDDNAAQCPPCPVGYYRPGHTSPYQKQASHQRQQPTYQQQQREYQQQQREYQQQQPVYQQQQPVYQQQEPEYGYQRQQYEYQQQEPEYQRQQQPSYQYQNQQPMPMQPAGMAKSYQSIGVGPAASRPIQCPPCPHHSGGWGQMQMQQQDPMQRTVGVGTGAYEDQRVSFRENGPQYFGGINDPGPGPGSMQRGPMQPFPMQMQPGQMQAGQYVPNAYCIPMGYFQQCHALASRRCLENQYRFFARHRLYPQYFRTSRRQQPAIELQRNVDISIRSSTGGGGAIVEDVPRGNSKHSENNELGDHFDDDDENSNNMPSQD